MAAPLPRPERREYRANWLGRYLKVEDQYKGELRKALQDASIAIDNAFAKARFKETRTGAVQRQQMALAHREIRSEVKNLFGTTEGLIRDRKQDAAVAAVNASLYDQRGMLRRIFKNPADSREYADSLRQTAFRNIEAVEARVLDSWFPLAETVWGTRNLAQGFVDTAINSGLARGSSAEDIAKDVRALVNPDVPGGVSYAALRLGRTEINNAFHAQAIQDAVETPWIQGMRWNLSMVHRDDPGDECEDYEAIGVFPNGLVPDKPHPNCRCYVTPDLPEYADFENALLMGQYDEYLDGVMGEESAALIDYAGLVPTGVAKGPSLAPIAPAVSIGPTEPNVVDTGTISDAPNLAAATYRFTEKYDHVSVLNFKESDINVDTAKEILGGLDHMMTKHPEAADNLKQVVLGWGPDFEYARTIREWDGKSTIKWNMGWTRDPEAHAARMAENVADGFHVPNSQERPFYSNTIHEFGHVMDFKTREGDGNTIAMDRANTIQTDMALSIESYGKKFTREWEAMIPSKYATENEAELIAESVTDVELNGDGAKEMSKRIYKMLTGMLKGRK